MDTLDAIRARRSVKDFTERPLAREELEALLELAALAPNHRMTEPWGFIGSAGSDFTIGSPVPNFCDHPANHHRWAVRSPVTGCGAEGKVVSLES